MTNIPSATKSITTIQRAPAPAAEAPAAEAESAGASESGAESSSSVEPAQVAAPREAEPDRDTELVTRFDKLSQRETKARRFEASLHEQSAKLAAKEKELEAKLAEMEEALSDPVEYYLKKGKNPVDIAKRFAQPETAEEKRLRKLEETLAKKEEEEQRRETEWKERQEAQQKEHAMRSFVKSIAPDECPSLTALYQPREVPGLVREFLGRSTDESDPEAPTVLDAFIDEYNRPPTDLEIRQALEFEASSRATRLLERSRTAASSQVEPDTAAEGPGISNQHAAESARTNSSRGKSRAEIKRELTERLEAEAAQRR